MAANLLFIAIPALIATAISRGPFLYTMTEPSGTKPWADSPMKLVSTPQFETKKVRRPAHLPDHSRPRS